MHWRFAYSRIEQIRGNGAVALNRRREILRPRRSQPLPAAGLRSVGIDKIEIGGVVIGVLGRANRAFPKRVNGAAFAALVANPGIIDRKRRQSGIARAFLVKSIRFRVGANRVKPIREREAGAAGVVVKERDARVIRECPLRKWRHRWQ